MFLEELLWQRHIAKLVLVTNLIKPQKSQGQSNIQLELSEISSNYSLFAKKGCSFIT